MGMLFGAYPHMWRFACTKVVRTTSHHFASKYSPSLNSVTLHGKALTWFTSGSVRTRMLQAELLNRENRGCCSFFFWPGPRDPNFFSGSENLEAIFGDHFSSPISLSVGGFRRESPLPTADAERIRPRAPRFRMDSLAAGPILALAATPKTAPKRHESIPH
jgi:hypothetical protein